MRQMLIDDLENILKTAWSIRIAAFWIIVGTFILVAPLMSDELKALLGPWQFGGALFLAGVSFGLARVMKQPGTESSE